MSYGQQSLDRGRVALPGTQLDYVFVGYQGTVQVSNAQSHTDLYPHLSNNLGWLRVINSAKILLHCRVIVSLLVEKVAILAVDGILLQSLNPDLLRKVNSQHVEVALVEDFEFLLETLLTVTEDLIDVS